MTRRRVHEENWEHDRETFDDESGQTVEWDEQRFPAPPNGRARISPDFVGPTPEMRAKWKEQDDDLERQVRRLLASRDRERQGDGDDEQHDRGDLRSRMIRGDEFILDAPDQLPLVWGDDDNAIWAEGQSLEIVGPIGTGKTSIAGQLVRARLGLSDRLLGFPVQPGRRNVLVLACDRAPQIAQAFRRSATEDERDVLHERCLVWRGPPPADFAKCPEMLLELALAADADTVIIDSFKDVAIGLAKDEVGAGLNNAIQLALVAGVEVVGLHHQRKGQDGKPPKTLEDVFGSTWITAGAGSVILLWGEAGDPIIDLSQLKPLAATIGPWKIEHDHDQGATTIHTGAVDPLTMLRHAPNGLTAEDVARVLFDKTQPTENDKAKARGRLRRLVNKGLATQHEATLGGSGGSTPTRYYATPTNDETSEP
jgi:replicative DNA helicase